MSLTTVDDVIQSLVNWKEELSEIQGERERKLISLKRERELINAKAVCLVNIAGRISDRPSQQLEAFDVVRDRATKNQSTIRQEIETLEIEINANEEINREIFSEIDRGIEGLRKTK